MEYEYRPKWTMIVFVATFFALCAVVLGYAAVDNDRGLIIDGIIAFGAGGATVFYWVLTVLSAGFVVIAAFLAFHRTTFHQRLVFGPEAMTVPASRWSRAEKEIAYRDIASLSKAAVSSQRFLYVKHSGGKYTIAIAMLPSAAAFEEVCDLLATKVRQARSTE
jgi:hypothetical protein